MAKKTPKTNDDAEVTDVVPQNELDDIFGSLVSDDPMDRQYKFFLYWLFGFPQKVCAMKTGYSESYASKLVQKYKNVPELRHKVDGILNMFPERYRSFCKLKLPQIAEIDGKALQEYDNNPRLAIDKPQLLKQIKQGAGVDLNDQASSPKIATVNIKELRLIHQDLNPYKPEVIDAEIIEEDD